MENLKDYLLMNQQTEQQNVVPRKKTNVEYSAVFVSGPDFGIRRKTKMSSSVLVCILTASQIYIKNEKNGQIKQDAGAEDIAKFLSDTEDGYDFGDEHPNFIRRLKRGKDYAERFMKFVTNEKVLALIKKGYIFVDDDLPSCYYLGNDHIDREVRSQRPFISQLLEIAAVCEKTVGIDETRAAISTYCGCRKHNTKKVQNLIGSLLLYADSINPGFLIKSQDGQETAHMSGFGLLESRYGLDGARRYIAEILHSPAQEAPDAQYLLQIMFLRTENSAARVYYGRHVDLEPAQERVFELDRFIEYTVYESYHQGFAFGYDLNNMFTTWNDDLNMQVMIYGKIVDKYPENLLTHHQIMASKANAIKQEIDERNWQEAVRRMEVFECTDCRFAIVAPKTVKDMIEEAQQQSNCLASYVSNVTDGTCMIFFLRKVSDPEKSFVTIEIRGDGSLGQVKAKFNRAPSSEAMDFVLKWHRTKVAPVFEQILQK